MKSFIGRSLFFALLLYFSKVFFAQSSKIDYPADIKNPPVVVGLKSAMPGTACPVETTGSILFFATDEIAGQNLYRCVGGTWVRETFVYVGIASAAPATCTVGQLYFATDAAAGQNVRLCTATNTWTTLTSLTLQTNGTPNGSQSLLNLAAGSNITLTDNGSGQVTIAGSAGAALPGQAGNDFKLTVSTTSTANDTLNVAPGSWLFGGQNYVQANTCSYTVVSNTVGVADVWFSPSGFVGVQFTSGGTNALTQVGTTTNCAVPTSSATPAFPTDGSKLIGTVVITGASAFGAITQYASLTGSYLIACSSGLSCTPSGTTVTVAPGASIVQNNQTNTFAAGSTVDLSLANSLGVPQGAANPATCTVGQVFFNTATPGFVGCGATNTWSALGGGTPGGTSGQIQYNNAGAFGGFTQSGDCTTVTSTGVTTCVQVNGTGFQVSSSGTVTKFGGVATVDRGVPYIQFSSNVTGQSTSQGAVTVASPGAGNEFDIAYYASQNALCTSGSNSVTFTFNWTDAITARNFTTPSLTLGSASSTSAFVSGHLFISAASSTVTYSSTVTGACTTGTSSYDVHVQALRTR